MRIFWLLGVVVSVGLSGCCNDSSRSGSESTVSVGWQPPALPLKLVVSSNGEVTVTTERSINTPIGRFSLEGGIPIVGSKGEEWLVIIKHRRTGDQKQLKYRSGHDSDEVRVVTTGTTDFRVIGKQIIIDVTNSGTVEINPDGGGSRASTTKKSGFPRVGSTETRYEFAALRSSRTYRAGRSNQIGRVSPGVRLKLLALAPSDDEPGKNWYEVVTTDEFGREQRGWMHENVVVDPGP